MAHILCSAENFAYGPAGKLLTIASELNALGHDLTFVGYGTSYDLASQSSIFQAVHEIDTELEDPAPLLLDLASSADLVISCMDKGTVRAAKTVGVPSVWIDSLFYWWDDLPKEVLAADLYVKQDVLPDAQNMQRYGKSIENLLSIGPLVESRGRNRDFEIVQNRALICFGGMDAPGWYEAGKNHDYPTVVTRLLHEVEFEGFDELIVTGASHIMEELDQVYGGSKFQFRSLPHHVFVQMLAESRVALLAGGLESTLEAFANRVPAIFLPPLNVTHHLQVQSLREAGAANASISYDDYYPRFDWATKTRREKVDEFLDRARLFERDSSVQEDVTRRIQGWLVDDDLLDRQVRAQSAFMTGLKPRGRAVVLDAVESLLNSNAKGNPSARSSHGETALR
ncbi:hypothetical protein ACO229_14200 [Promicromonospora sp. MS192]|uniref:hypothetical protein n=1 Tax=Promicromonospora sp. MS192 TaxID=3412684 RepID=UPI003C3021EB